MSERFPLLDTAPDLLEAVVRQGQTVKGFVAAEKQAEAVRELFIDALDPALYQAGGLLNEQMLEAFFASPLPDAPLATALRSIDDGGMESSVDASSLYRERNAQRGKAVAQQRFVQVEKTAQGRKSQTSHKVESTQAEGEQSASVKGESIKKPSRNVQDTQTIEQKVRVFEASTKRVHSSDEQQAADATQIKYRGKPAAAKKQNKGASAALAFDRAKPPGDTKDSDQATNEQPINRHQASKLLAEKWNNKAWNSPIKTDRQSARIRSQEDKEYPQSLGLNEVSAQRQNESMTAENKLQQKIMQILNVQAESAERDKAESAPPMDKSQREQQAIANGMEAQQRKRFSDLDNNLEQAQAFTPDPSISPQPERLVGLRGLAARAAANASAPAVESVESVASANETKLGKPANGPASAAGFGAQVATSGQAQTQRLTATQAGATAGETASRPMSVAELAEVIAEEARRAGIDLEQFQP